MKIIPIQGLHLSKSVVIPVRAYKMSQLARLFKHENIKNEEDKLFIDLITFTNRDDLSTLIKDQEEVQKILSKFSGTEAFAVINKRFNTLTEFYDLRVALSIMYIAYRMNVEKETDFLKQVLVTNGYSADGYSEYGYIQSTFWDVKIGVKPIDENDFDVTVPVYYTDFETSDGCRNVPYRKSHLQIHVDISEQIEKLYSRIIGSDQMSAKLRSALNLLYTTFSFNNLDAIIPTYATILETLLLCELEDNQRKKVSVRSACLIKNDETFESKEYIASWVFYFYQYRNAIVHNGKSNVELRMDEEIIFNHVISFIQHLIFNIIKIIVTENITCIKDIKKIVSENGKKDGLDNNFKYISEQRSLYFEE